MDKCVKLPYTQKSLLREDIPIAIMSCQQILLPALARVRPCW